MQRIPADAAAVQHVDGRHFALGLQEDAARLAACKAAAASVISLAGVIGYP